MRFAPNCRRLLCAAGFAAASFGWFSPGAASSSAPIPPPPSTADAPFIETFQHDGRSVMYVPALHHSPVQYPDARLDPVFKTIEDVFSKTPPDTVIVEGVDPSIPISHFLDFARQCAATNYNLPGKGCAESALAGALADKAGATVYTGEPSSRTVFQAFERYGYSMQDYLAFWIINYIPYEKRQESLTAKKFPQVVDKVVRYQNYLLGTAAIFTVKDFEAWYAAHMPTPRNYLDIVTDDTGPAPRPGEPNTIMHTLAALSDSIRDQNVVATIKSALASHHRVLVVYGASHLEFEWNALVGLLGVPVKSKPF